MDDLRHLVERRCSADSRFGWCRTFYTDLNRRQGRPTYTLWRISRGKRYMILVWTVDTSRHALAREIRLARWALRMVIAGEYAGAEEDRVMVKRYLRGKPVFKNWT